MSMEQRHREIRERAGREEARLNQEFIDFLKRWGTPILMVAAALSLGYVGLDYLKKQRAAGVDAAFTDLQGVSPGGFLAASPDSLINVANSHGNVVGVSYMARLGAGDAWLQAIRTGLRPGAVLSSDGTPETPEDLLSDADRSAFLDRAAEAYGSVLREAEGRKGHEIHAIGALYGLAAVEEARGNKDAARGHLNAVKAISERCKFDLHLMIVDQRIAALEASNAVPPLVSRAELPVIAPPAEPVPSPVEGEMPSEPSDGSGAAPEPAAQDPAGQEPAGDEVPTSVPPSEPKDESAPAADPE